MTGNLFTPFAFEGTRMRAYMLLNEEDNAKISGDWSEAEVVDLVTGRLFLVRKADCGLGCRCAAVVVREVAEAGIMPGYVGGVS